MAVGATGESHRYQIPSSVATVIRRRSAGGFVIGTAHGLMVADERLAAFEPFASVSDDPTLRTNDGCCDPLGGFVIGTMSCSAKPDRGAVFRVSADGRVTELIRPVTISNGIQFSKDGATAYYIDSPTCRVDAFDVDAKTGVWSNQRTHILVEDAKGIPDGMAIDEDGGLWVALWGAGAVNHYDAGGDLVDQIVVPGITLVSSCAFGGREGNELYITTSRLGLAPREEPAAGAVFRFPTTVRGAPLAKFSG